VVADVNVRKYLNTVGMMIFMIKKGRKDLVLYGQFLFMLWTFIFYLLTFIFLLVVTFLFQPSQDREDKAR
jgi:hypothetical protein